MCEPKPWFRILTDPDAGTLSVEQVDADRRAKLLIFQAMGGQTLMYSLAIRRCTHFLGEMAIDGIIDWLRCVSSVYHDELRYVDPLKKRGPDSFKVATDKLLSPMDCGWPMSRTAAMGSLLPGGLATQNPTEECRMFRVRLDTALVQCHRRKHDSQ
jgi:hypothetical protein